MADTVDLNEITEYNDEPRVLREKVEKLFEMIRSAKHMTVFTGAGISTSAKIPDFRGPQGVWTCKAKGVKCPSGVSLTQALPTVCHNYIRSLVDDGTIKYIVSQNVDGLHRRSGIARDKLSELHGNCFLEVCWKCGADYERQFEVSEDNGSNEKCKECKARVPHFCHCTSRKCENCNTKLKDSVIHFGENLPVEALQRAYDHAEQSDLCVVFGSSLRVSPANKVPVITKKNKGKLVIINLQTTPLDDSCDVRIFAKTDEVCEMLQALAAADRSTALNVSASTPVPSAPPMFDTDVAILFGNKHQLVNTQDGNAHQWEMFVELRPLSSTYAIDSVTYNLHPTFSPSSITVKEPSFTITRLGWGTFTVGIVVALKNLATGAISQHNLDHALSFSAPVTQASVEIKF